MAVVTAGIEVDHQRHPSAIAVVETERPADDHHFVAHHLDCLAAGTRYPQIRLPPHTSILTSMSGLALASLTNNITSAS